MRIACIKICNFRSFGPEPQVISFEKKLICFIGLNSAGKTAALTALQKLFGSYSERKLFREDFHIAQDDDGTRENERSLWIEVVIKFDDGEDAIPIYFADMVVNEVGQAPFLRIRLEAIWTPSLSSMEGEVQADQYIIKVAEGEAETPAVKKEFPKSFYGLFQVIYVPALRKTADQVRYASGSILHRLLKTVEYTDQFKNDYKDVTEVTNALFQALPTFTSIQKSMQDLWACFHKDTRYREATMDFGSGELDELLRKLEVNFTPGQGAHRRFGVDDLGDGYRSLFYLTLVCTLLEIEAGMPVDAEIDGSHRPLLTLLAVEEPENHIAPHLLGRVIKVLVGMADKPNAQVFLTSHTPAIVKRLEPETIFHFRITDESATEVNGIKLPQKADEAYKYVKEAVQNFPEIYFAKLVVIGEGDSEQVVFNHLMRVMDTNFDDNIITFAPLGHRFVSHIWRLLSTLNIPFITLLDFDLERNGGGWGRIKYVLQELMNVGKDTNELLRIRTGVLSRQQLGKMHTWDASNTVNMEAWMNRLKKYGVYFSNPLDLDFMMLEAYEDYYTDESSYPVHGGPDIPDPLLEDEQYKEYLANAIAATLKNKDAKGVLYTGKQHELMIWYKYHFLGRGKPVTHIQVLAQIDDGTIKENLPAVLDEIFKEIENRLS
jgi:predicted ATP-dependent endonuclease of OLD family